jgi:preprotein translocase subunit SecG
MLYYLVVTLYVLVCGLLIITILLQQGKGGDIANAFGGGSSQAVFGARSGATLLTRATSVLAALFVVGALVLTVWGARGPSSVVGGIDAPPPAPAPTNTTPAPAANTPMPPPGNSTP